ncbi:fatty acid desaturase family protein [Flectobacillus major]|jgi:linoleoyl-CoA desaturase|uniref:fatty acid desaturase family protein n=1 Tax=Flectobacillus major TaxID=103 RepID=UPI000401A908|nr:acyl-CoA desaturase [Flectobacillus major]
MEKVSFNNKNSVFFNALRKRVNEYFQANDIRPTGNYKLYLKTAILLAAAFLLYVVLVFFTPVGWLSIGLSALLGFNLAAIGFNVMHDGAHGSFSQKKWVNELMGYSLNIMGGSVYLWKFKHNFNHHSFTNIDGMDDDIDIKPWMRVSETQEKHWFHRFQHIYWIFLYGWTYLLWIFWQDFQKYFTGKVGDTKFRKMDLKEHAIFWATKLGYVGVFIVLPIYQVGLLDALIGYFIIAFVCGFVSAVVFQLAHVVEQAQFPMPDEQTAKIDTEWAIHQIRTTANFATKSKIVSWFTGGLNFQVEHHLFPKISHVHYPKINELVRETCQQFGITYLEYPTVLSALRSHIVHLKHIGTV